ncbi:protein of unknown function [Evansella caseinilytica]|uniref:DnaJ homologue subfamily C member 28 conserved domain-containing protein n=1 Tax=Evansella caseinilytica TaxID=1503961 RepID=A0A1H3QBZ8_9BACI|nr:DUF1992 domain-containing protein [Evansella caseinilytica]SDZ10926.1 protein of unknown function [Evansella caseinilytica]
MSRLSDESSGHDLMSKIYKEYEKKGGFDDLPGKGKPLPAEALTGDALYGILKNANYLPAWVAKQHEVRDAILELLQQIEQEKLPLPEQEKRIKEMNKKVKKYNKMCPMMLQKPLVSRESLTVDKERWS